MSAIRRPVAAGTFYPARAAELADLVDRLLAGARPSPFAGSPRALVAPHAGYRYSGAVAAAAFATLRATEAGLRVALLGPSHFVPLRGAAVTGVEAWQTALGTIPVDRELRAAAVEAGAAVDEVPHRDDHALEVQLPFLQRRVHELLRVLPIAVGEDADVAASVLAALAPLALVVVSTDLSHYHDDATARRLDRRTADAVLARDADAIGVRDACGAHALRALLRHARSQGWDATLLDLRTSADAAGDRGHVVGYGAFAFTAENPETHAAGHAGGGALDLPRTPTCS